MMENGSPPVEQWEHPLCLLADPVAYAQWTLSRSSEEARAITSEATKRHMQVHGTHSVFDVGEKLDDATAALQEFVC